MPYRTVIQVEVLSSYPYKGTDLDQIQHDITDGDCSGVVKLLSSEEVPADVMRELLLSQNSDPDLFDERWT